MKFGPVSNYIGKPRALARLATGVRNVSTAATPLTIMGANLVGWWNAESTSQITIATGVSSWKDDIGNYDLVQATGLLQPVYSATSFNGRPGVTFNGSTQYLRTASVPASFPLGSSTAEIWICMSQDTPAGTAGTLIPIGYGANSGTESRLLRRLVVSTVNRANIFGSGTSASNTGVDFSGRHYVRAQFVNAAITAAVDGTAGASGNATLATTGSNVTVAASCATVPTGYNAQVVHQILFLDTTPSAAQITALNAYFAARL